MVAGRVRAMPMPVAVPAGMVVAVPIIVPIAIPAAVTVPAGIIIVPVSVAVGLPAILADILAISVDVPAQLIDLPVQRARLTPIALSILFPALAFQVAQPRLVPPNVLLVSTDMLMPVAVVPILGFCGGQADHAAAGGYQTQRQSPSIHTVHVTSHSFRKGFLFWMGAESSLCIYLRARVGAVTDAKSLSMACRERGRREENEEVKMHPGRRTKLCGLVLPSRLVSIMIAVTILVMFLLTVPALAAVPLALVVAVPIIIPVAILVPVVPAAMVAGILAHIAVKLGNLPIIVARAVPVVLPDLSLALIPQVLQLPPVLAQILALILIIVVSILRFDRGQADHARAGGDQAQRENPAVDKLHCYLPLLSKDFVVSLGAESPRLVLC